MNAEPVGRILPGTVKVEEIIQMNGELPRSWRITLVSRPGEAGALTVLEATVKFVSGDPMLVEQLRRRKLWYALDLLQIEGGDTELLDIGSPPKAPESPQDERHRSQ